MTLLEYVCERLMGPPVSGSCWRCPICDSSNPSFSVRPPKGNYPIKWKCWRCGEWGDALDLLKHFYPKENYGERRDRLRQLTEDFESGKPCGEAAASSSRGLGSSSHQEYECDWRVVARTWTDVLDEMHDIEIGGTFALQILSAIVDRCEREGVSVYDLLMYWQGFEDWIVQTDLQHYEECNDPKCDAAICRIRRGLEPLTARELAEERRQEREEHERRMERARKMIKKGPVSVPAKRKPKPKKR